MTDITSALGRIILQWMPEDITDDSSALIQFMLSGNRPWPEPMLTRFYDAIWCHKGPKSYVQYLTKFKSVLFRTVLQRIYSTTRFVNHTPTSEVTSVTICYVQPPHHVHTKVSVMFMNGRHASLWFHVNRPFHSWNKVMCVVKGHGHTVGQYLINLLPFWFTPIRPTIPEIELFRNLTLRNPRSRSWVSHSSPSIQPMHFLFISRQSDQPFLRHGQ